jgi:hypothetical protein
MMTLETGSGYEVVVSGQWSVVSGQSEENPDGVSATDPGGKRAAHAAHYQILCPSA